MKTVPLRGAKAAGRVALVDDEDYDLVMQHKWHVWELPPRPGKRRNGPYAVNGTLRMHALITGWPLTDHEDHNTLNNQRYNLRPATHTQNLQNALGHINTTSQYKGVWWVRAIGKWEACISVHKTRVHLGYFLSELEAAYVYDAAARQHFGEFALPNFSEGPDPAMAEQWRAEREAAAVIAAANGARLRGAQTSERMKNRELETRICVVCGDEYQTRAIQQTLYCGDKCSRSVQRPREHAKRRQLRQQERERWQAEPTIWACVICGTEVQAKTRHTVLYCSKKCNRIARSRRDRAAAEAQREGRLF